MGQCLSQGDTEAKRNHAEAEIQLKKVNFPEDFELCLANCLTVLGKATNGKGGKGTLTPMSELAYTKRLRRVDLAAWPGRLGYVCRRR
jgi:hypothetical protein